MKPWGGRFKKETDKEVEAFTASAPFDWRLAPEDIRGSMAHAAMLKRIGVLTEAEEKAILQGLEDIAREIEEGTFTFTVELEDVHMNIEKRLTDKIGPLGGKLHTARSRNDQVALDMHLFMMRENREVEGLLKALQAELLAQAEKNLQVIFPGYTHLQRAQPILFSHHLLAYFWMFQRDRERLKAHLTGCDLMPLGSGALAGTTFPVDREGVAAELGFSRLYENSMDAVSDRDFLLEFLSAASIIMMHLSRFSEEIILWSSAEFNFIELDDAFTTGSSIMPQKKNPDVAELVRGKTGRVYGNLMALLTVLKGLPLAYNKDMQEDKEGLFDTLDTVKDCLHLFTEMLKTLQVKEKVMLKAVSQDFSNATDLADYLVRRVNLPFREAHALVGKMVAYCLDQGKFLQDLDQEELQHFHPALGPGVQEILEPLGVVSARTSRGGTAPSAVTAQITRAWKALRDET
jgi:argininosuccinate lyase